jgi:hypothetical protein
MTVREGTGETGTAVAMRLDEVGGGVWMRR